MGSAVQARARRRGDGNVLLARDLADEQDAAALPVDRVGRGADVFLGLSHSNGMLTGPCPLADA